MTVDNHAWMKFKTKKHAWMNSTTTKLKHILPSPSCRGSFVCDMHALQRKKYNSKRLLVALQVEVKEKKGEDRTERAVSSQPAETREPRKFMRKRWVVSESTTILFG